MLEQTNTLIVKAYGVLNHSGYRKIHCAKNQLIQGKTISIENHSYEIVSVIESDTNQYLINVMLPEQIHPEMKTIDNYPA